ncbi:hypothetical protein BDB00DRAFT_791806 [Zychaea mexicana]|uniref:uncharacterized protein n=1 Tax=Zychaea mexicana TaxID=64656 RepID=UPI0022FE50FF|nr:uncharacterized protein BDB00DRAFT_791806 [Zychaea mexicana]KAI9488553.1 hypothetical protein BDB00DRAFT_791806 [Zychaea mexicana]
MVPYDAWSLQTWLTGLPKMALCHILTTVAMKSPRVMQMIEDHQPSANLLKNNINKQHPMSPTPSATTMTMTASTLAEQQQRFPPAGDFYQEILRIQERARSIVHSLDGCRPSEQFANEAALAEELQRVVRWCTNTLHASTRGHSLAALMGLLAIAREGLSAIPEIRKYLFGKAHLGRMVVLEMSSVLKNFKNTTHLPDQWSLLLSILEAPHAVVQDHHRHQVAWVVQLLRDVCAQMAHCDRSWRHLQEYEHVVAIAERNCWPF